MTEVQNRKIEWFLFAALLLVALLNLTKVLAVDSLWLDETLTFWIVKDGLQDAAERAAQFQGQSPFYYSLAWGFRELFDSGPENLRLLSVIFSVLGLVVCWRFLRRFLPLDSALFSVLVLFSFDSYQVAFVSARPYALAQFFWLASLLAIFRWLDSSRIIWLAIYTVCAALAFYAHYLFGLGFVLQLILVFGWAGPRKLGQLLGAQMVVGLICAPTIPQLSSLAERTDQLELSSSPGIYEFFVGWLPPDLIIYLALAGAVSALFYGKCWRSDGSKQSVKLFLIGAFSAPLVILGLHLIAGITLYQARYFLWSIPFLAGGIGLVFNALRGAAVKLTFAGMFVLLLLVRSVDKEWKSENWRGAALSLNAQYTENQLLLVNSGLVEFRKLANLENPGFSEYLLAPFVAYPVRAQTLLVPFNFDSDAARSYFIRVLQPELTKHGEFYLVTLGELASRGQFARIGFSVSKREVFGRVVLLTFKRGDSNVS